MATVHRIPINNPQQSGVQHSPLDVAWFNSQASDYFDQSRTSPDNGDTGIFVDDNNISVMPEERLYTYGNKLWFLNVLPTDFNDLHIGLASEFRESLNDNFSQISDQADTVDKNLELLRDKLKPVATTALASDLILDSGHRTVTDAEKTSWTERAVYVDNDPQLGAHRIKYNNGSTTVDITEAVANYITANIPSTTQGLGYYDNKFILVTKDGYSRPVNNYWHVTKSDESPSVLHMDNEHASQYGWTYMVVFENASITSNHIPYVFFNQSTYSNGYYTATCVSENGKIKFGSSVSTLPNNFDATIVIVSASQSLSNGG